MVLVNSITVHSSVFLSVLSISALNNNAVTKVSLSAFYCKILPLGVIVPCVVSAHLSIPEVHLVLLEHLPTDYAPVINDDIEVGPSMELALPVGNGGEGCNDEERPLDANAINLLQECDGLDGFPQAHLICQDAVASEMGEVKKDGIK